MEKGERVTDPHHQIPRIEQWAFEFTKVYLGVMMKTLASLTRLGGGDKNNFISCPKNKFYCL